ncbi:MAG: dihydrodipicolinate synthase family protein [Spirochaetia bacterium]
MTENETRQALLQGGVIPAMPLALTENRELDERHQRALLRYYLESGVRGIAAGVHTTQFEVRTYPRLFERVLRAAAEEIHAYTAGAGAAVVKVGGVLGLREQALGEARQLRDLGYDCALLSLSAHVGARLDDLIAHCRAVADIIPVVGFYLQEAVGGIQLPYEFWRRFAEIERVVAIKVAPFNRYRTIDVLRAVAESGRAGEIALYTGNDDSIVFDLLSEYDFRVGDDTVRAGFVGGLLGQWAVWTKSAVELVEAILSMRAAGVGAPQDMLVYAHELTDANAAIFDAANGFRGSIAGIHEILRRQGLFRGVYCLDPSETLSPGQMEEIDRVLAAYPHLTDEAYVAANLNRWLAN